MFIELVEALRCVHSHEESWLVASIDVMRERSIVSGSLGCPVCGARYPIVDSVADFTEGAPAGQGDQSELSDEQLAIRAGAFLGLSDATGLIVLAGDWARGAADLARVTHVRIVCVNPPDGVRESSSVCLTRAADTFPVGAGGCVGVALDSSATPDAVGSAAQSLQPGGRLIAPASVGRPAVIREIASDSSYWVGEKPPELTSLRKASR